MKLEEIIKVVEPKEIKNYDKNIEITGISYNSQKTKSGDLFVCLQGEYADGHNWAKMAKERGAVALLCERELEVELPQIIVNSTRHKIAEVAALLYDYPSKKLELIGVTGTNGKTTVTHLLQKIYEANNKKCALIGTLGYKMSSSDTYHDAKHTTPQAPELQATLKKIVENGINSTVMEVSSHALEQNRVGRCHFKGAVLTNLTQDHLDYHITMENYFEAKAILFKGLKPGDFAVINADDEYAQKFLEVIPKGVKVLTYGIKKAADVVASDILGALSEARPLLYCYEYFIKTAEASASRETMTFTLELCKLFPLEIVPMSRSQISEKAPTYTNLCNSIATTLQEESSEAAAVLKPVISCVCLIAPPFLTIW